MTSQHESPPDAPSVRTRPPQFGVSLTQCDASVASRAVALEEQGWDVVAVGEHVSFNGPVPSSFVHLAAIAAVTERIRLLSSVTLLPLYPAALAAKMGAALDIISGGRFILGAGLGGENPREFDACGVDIRTRGRKADESLELLRRLWTGEAVSYEGEFAKLDRVAIDPPPHQQSGIPIWIAGRKQAAMRRAALLGDGWFPYMYSPEQMRDSLATISELRPADREPIDAGMFVWACVHPDRDTAIDLATRRLGQVYGQDFGAMMDKYLIVGTPDECAKRVRDYLDAGAGTVVFGAACEDDHLDMHLQLLMEEVIPAVRAAER